MRTYDAHSLVDFLNSSPCNFFAVATIKKHLEENGFTELKQDEIWNLQKEAAILLSKTTLPFSGLLSATGHSTNPDST